MPSVTASTPRRKHSSITARLSPITSRASSVRKCLHVRSTCAGTWWYMEQQVGTQQRRVVVLACYKDVYREVQRHKMRMIFDMKLGPDVISFSSESHLNTLSIFIFPPSSIALLSQVPLILDFVHYMYFISHL